MVFILCARLETARDNVLARVMNIELNHYTEAIVRASHKGLGRLSWK